MGREAPDPVRDIRQRAVQYSLRAVRLFQILQRSKDRAGWILGTQFLRSATSIGANLEEAQAAESRPDFIHKHAIAQKEARESRYWLRLIAESEMLPEDRLAPIIQETEELLAIISKIIVRTESSPSR